VSKKTSEQPIVFQNSPLDADAYVIYTDMAMTDTERQRICMEWDNINSHLPKSKILLVVPEKLKLEEVPSNVLWGWMDSCMEVLKGRGENDIR
jgi:hypothetical protein